MTTDVDYTISICGKPVKTGTAKLKAISLIFLILCFPFLLPIIFLFKNDSSKNNENYKHYRTSNEVTKRENVQNIVSRSREI